MLIKWGHCHPLWPFKISWQDVRQKIAWLNPLSWKFRNKLRKLPHFFYCGANENFSWISLFFIRIFILWHGHWIEMAPKAPETFCPCNLDAGTMINCCSKTIEQNSWWFTRKFFRASDRRNLGTWLDSTYFFSELRLDRNALKIGV